jgi:outer membrane protein insertion porin family
MRPLLISCALTILLGTGIWAAEERPSDPALRAVVFQGNQSLSNQELRRFSRLKSGMTLHEDRVLETIKRVQAAYRNEGFIQVKIATSTVWIDTETADFLFNIQEGPRYDLGTLTIQGNHEVSTATIRREFEIHTGDVFNYGKMLEANQRLYASGCFSIVDLILSTTTAQRIDVIVSVRERDSRFFKGAVGYGTQSKERVTVGYEDQNFLGGARRLDIKSTFSGFWTDPAKYQTTRLEGNLVQPYFLDSRWDARGNLSEEWDKREAYDSDATTLLTSVDRRFTSAFTTSVRYRFSGTRVTRISPETETPAFSKIGALGPSLRYDNTDDPFLPWNGWRLQGTFEEGLKLRDDYVGFHRLDARAGRFNTALGWTFFEGIQSGFILPRTADTSDIIPIYERYFIGGANTVRGYSERSLGPKDSNGDPLGGTQFLVFNFEIRHQIYKKLFGVTFLDAGQLYEYNPPDRYPHFQLTGFDSLRYGTGGGLRLHSPIGAIRLELGYQLNPEGNSTKFKDRTAVHFSIGEVF